MRRVFGFLSSSHFIFRTQHYVRSQFVSGWQPSRSFADYYPKLSVPPRPGSHPFRALGGDDSTIFALSTAPGRAAIAVIRISGPACLKIYEGLCPDLPLLKPRYASVRTIYEPQTGSQILDSKSLVLYFPAPRTATGEDVLEFHVHGGPAIVKAVLAAIPRAVQSSTLRSHVVRYAEPGEFTRRAFYNDRLDLTQVEALGDTLSAETEQQRRLAVRGTTSTLAERYNSWQQKLLYARGELEALIDFSEDQHFDESPLELVSSISKQVQELRYQVQANIENASRGELLRNGISIALLGAPNAGKSSLLNAIVGKEAAIVSKEEGTTRDVVEANVDIGGFFCKFGDLAGLRKSTNHGSGVDRGTAQIGEVEQEGIRRAKERALNADVVLVVLALEIGGNGVRLQISPEITETIAKCDRERQKVLYVVNKSDLISQLPRHDYSRVLNELQNQVLDVSNGSSPSFVSCIVAKGIDDKASDPGGIQAFLHSLVETFKEMTTAVTIHGDVPSSAWEESLGASGRQRLLLQQCLHCLDDFLSASNEDTKSNTHSDLTTRESDLDIVLAAESLREAATCLAKITGRGEAGGDVEDVLGVVFEKFCVGK